MAKTYPMDELSPAAWAEAGLAALDSQHTRRMRRVVESVDGMHLTVDGRRMLAFCGNDYLGLSQHPALVQAAVHAAHRHGVGATASPLVCGHSAEHEALESEVASFLGTQAAVYFHSGYGTNAGIVSALIGKDDLVFSDALNHACLIDGARLSRAQLHIYPHLDLSVLEAQLSAAPATGRRLILSDSVFSMDGTLAPLDKLLEMAERHGAMLLIDDAHGYGVLGAGGRGAVEHFGLDPRHPLLIQMATLSKAGGGSGAVVAASRPLVEWIWQRTRSYVFATAAPAMLAAAMRASVRVIQQEPERRGLLRQRIQEWTDASQAWQQPGTAQAWPSPSAVQPLILGDNARALAVMQSLWDEGLWVPAIRPPTVPAGTARLRISLSAAHTQEELARLVAAIHRALGA